MSRDKEDQKDKKTNTNRILMVIGPKICYPLLKNLILIWLRKKWGFNLLKKINNSKISRIKQEFLWEISLLFTNIRKWNPCGKSSFKTKSFTENWCFPGLNQNFGWFMSSFFIVLRKLLKLKSLMGLVEFCQQKTLNSKVHKYIIAPNEPDENIVSYWE